MTRSARLFRRISTTRARRTRARGVGRRRPRGDRRAARPPPRTAALDRLRREISELEVELDGWCAAPTTLRSSTGRSGGQHARRRRDGAEGGEGEEEGRQAAVSVSKRIRSLRESPRLRRRHPVEVRPRWRAGVAHVARHAHAVEEPSAFTVVAGSSGERLAAAASRPARRRGRRGGGQRRRGTAASLGVAFGSENSARR